MNQYRKCLVDVDVKEHVGGSTFQTVRKEKEANFHEWGKKVMEGSDGNYSEITVAIVELLDSGRVELLPPTRVKFLP